MPCRSRQPWPAGHCPKVIHTLIPAGCAQAGSRALCKKHPEHRQSPHRAGPGDPSRAYPQAGPPQRWTSSRRRPPRALVKIRPPRHKPRQAWPAAMYPQLVHTLVHALCGQPCTCAQGQIHHRQRLFLKAQTRLRTKNHQSPPGPARPGLQTGLQSLSTGAYTLPVHNPQRPDRKTPTSLQPTPHYGCSTVPKACPQAGPRQTGTTVENRHAGATDPLPARCGQPVRRGYPQAAPPTWAALFHDFCRKPSCPSYISHTASCSILRSVLHERRAAVRCGSQAE